jgi:hypothetical protein
MRALNDYGTSCSAFKFFHKTRDLFILLKKLNSNMHYVEGNLHATYRRIPWRNACPGVERRTLGTDNSWEWGIINIKALYANRPALK